MSQSLPFNRGYVYCPDLRPFRKQPKRSLPNVVSRGASFKSMVKLTRTTQMRLDLAPKTSRLVSLNVSVLEKTTSQYPIGEGSQIENRIRSPAKIASCVRTLVPPNENNYPRRTANITTNARVLAKPIKQANLTSSSQSHSTSHLLKSNIESNGKTRITRTLHNKSSGKPAPQGKNTVVTCSYDGGRKDQLNDAHEPMFNSTNSNYKRLQKLANQAKAAWIELMDCLEDESTLEPSMLETVSVAKLARSSTSIETLKSDITKFVQSLINDAVAKCKHTPYKNIQVVQDQISLTEEASTNNDDPGNTFKTNDIKAYIKTIIDNAMHIGLMMTGTNVDAGHEKKQINKGMLSKDINTETGAARVVTHSNAGTENNTFKADIKMFVQMLIDDALYLIQHSMDKDIQADDVKLKVTAEAKTNASSENTVMPDDIKTYIKTIINNAIEIGLVVKSKLGDAGLDKKKSIKGILLNRVSMNENNNEYDNHYQSVSNTTLATGTNGENAILQAEIQTFLKTIVAAALSICQHATDKDRQAVNTYLQINEEELSQNGDQESSILHTDIKEYIKTIINNAIEIGLAMQDKAQQQ